MNNHDNINEGIRFLKTNLNAKGCVKVKNSLSQNVH